MDPNTPTGSIYTPGPQQFGHPSTWPANPAPQPAPPKRKRPARWPLVLVVAAVVLAATAGAVVAFTVSDKAPASVAASPPTGASASEEPVQLDERAACGALVPLLDEAVDLVLAYAKKEPWDKAAAQRAMDGFTAVYKAAPADMKSDISYQASTMSSIITGNGYDRDHFIESGTRLATRCRKYATG